jgi:hypothetical protein
MLNIADEAIRPEIIKTPHTTAPVIRSITSLDHPDEWAVTWQAYKRKSEEKE